MVAWSRPAPPCCSSSPKQRLQGFDEAYTGPTTAVKARPQPPWTVYRSMAASVIGSRRHRHSRKAALPPLYVQGRAACRRRPGAAALIENQRPPRLALLQDVMLHISLCSAAARPAKQHGKRGRCHYKLSPLGARRRQSMHWRRSRQMRRNSFRGLGLVHCLLFTIAGIASLMSTHIVPGCKLCTANAWPFAGQP